jgi:gamma-glutamylcyclotransferase (GGCT)/AIG2-like uncharacterized protein YtfP
MLFFLLEAAPGRDPLCNGRKINSRLEYPAPLRTESATFFEQKQAKVAKRRKRPVFRSLVPLLPLLSSVHIAAEFPCRPRPVNRGSYYSSVPMCRTSQMAMSPRRLFEPMKDYLFVYGTLSPDRAPPDVRGVVARLKPIAAGSMPGRVYHLGDFPGAVYEPASSSRVFGQVFELPDDDSFLRRLDEYEEYVPGDASRSLFVRERRPVDLPDGSQLSCWVYLYNRDPGKAPLVPGGNYVGWTATAQVSH